MWNKEKEDFLMSNWNKMLDKELISVLKVSPYSFYKKKRELGCTKTHWDDNKISLLKEYYPTSSWEDLFDILGCNSKTSIISMAYKFGIKRSIYNDKKLNDSDKTYIAQNSHCININEIAKTLNKSVEAVVRFCTNNELKYYYKNSLKPWDIDKFKEMYPFYTNKYLSNKYFTYLTPKQIRAQAQKLKIVKDVSKSVKWYDPENILYLLKQVILKIERVPLLIELETLGLPSEKTFTRYFGSFTKACELIGVERPTYANRKGKLSILKDNFNNYCFSMSEVIIGNILFDFGLPVEKEVKYKNFICDKMCGEKRCDWKIQNKIIEFFGMIGYMDYNNGVELKIELCKKHNIPLLDLYPEDIKNIEQLKIKIKQFLKI